MAYVPPTLAEFRARYPSFDEVADGTVQAWLTDGDAETVRFADDVRPRAVMLFAAHNLASQGLGTGTIAAGVTSFRSGAFSASLSEAAASRTGFAATAHGRAYLDLARIQFGGPRLAWEPPAAAAIP